MDCYIFQMRFIATVRTLRMAVFICCNYRPVFDICVLLVETAPASG